MSSHCGIGLHFPDDCGIEHLFFFFNFLRVICFRERVHMHEEGRKRKREKERERNRHLAN